ncbi:MAG: amidohydrolase family protein [Gemmatimonadota bacterium]
MQLLRGQDVVTRTCGTPRLRPSGFSVIRLSSIACGLVLWTCSRAAAQRPTGAPASVTITHVTVIDGTGALPMADMMVRIENGRIAGIENASKSPLANGTVTVDGRDRFLIPGLWDMHVHLWEPWPAPALGAWFLSNGIVGVRDMGTPLQRIRYFRSAFSSPDTPGPRIVAAGPFLDGRRSDPGTVIGVASDADGHDAVDSVLSWGGDFIKVLTGIPRPAFFGAAREARRKGVPIVGHLPLAVSPEEASDSGLRSFEHMFGTALDCAYGSDATCQSRMHRLATLDTARLIQTLRKNDSWQTPTLAAWHRVLRDQDGARSDDPRLALLPDTVRTVWLADETPTPAGLAEAVRREAALIAPMHHAGIRFLAGTDFGDPFLFPGASLHDELANLVAAGLTPTEALQSASRDAAIFLGLGDSTGTIAIGKRADLVLLEADPLLDIHRTRQVAAVFTQGRLFLRADLDSLIAHGRR